MKFVSVFSLFLILVLTHESRALREEFVVENIEPENVQSEELEPENVEGGIVLEENNEPESVEITEDIEWIESENQENFVEESHVEARWDAPKVSVKKASYRRGTVLESVTLPRLFKRAIVDSHNRLRSISKPMAANMRRMSWDNELAKIATQYTRQCIYEHNPNPKHSRFAYVGENLFISIGLPYEKELLVHAIEAWDEEKTVYDYTTRKCKPGKMCGHYTQVVWADSFKVGCGVTMCGNINVRGKTWKNSVLFACNYGPGGNYPTHPFINGPTCSKCDPSDTCRKGLCSNRMRDRARIDLTNVKWTKWSGWSPCTKSCGVGSQKRVRKCPTFVASDCKGFGSEVKFCFAKPCASTFNGGAFTYNIVLGEGDNLLQGSLGKALKGKLKGNLRLHNG